MRIRKREYEGEGEMEKTDKKEEEELGRRRRGAEEEEEIENEQKNVRRNKKKENEEEDDKGRGSFILISWLEGGTCRAQEQNEYTSAVGKPRPRERWSLCSSTVLHGVH
jgi:hypothetical protein